MLTLKIYLLNYMYEFYMLKHISQWYILLEMLQCRVGTCMPTHRHCARVQV